VFKRTKQVWAALIAHLTPVDEIYIAEHLNSREQQLFWQMALVDQFHALRVAKTAVALAERHPEVRRDLLRKAALLHDVGKMRGDISTLDKIITVLVYAVSPRVGRSIARPGKGGRIANLRHAFYIYGHHARRGAKLAANAGLEAPVVDWIRRHHQELTPADPWELRLLQAADKEH
jgi:putative nucleotidyltransferase with HDIG domain